MRISPQNKKVSNSGSNLSLKSSEAKQISTKEGVET